MASLLFQGSLATGLDESEAQSTVEPIRTDPADAELQSAPEFNAVESDDSGQLIGLSPRVVGSHTEAPVQTPPDLTNYGSAQTGEQERDANWAALGTAAQRENSGERGHGTILLTEGIEPLNPAQEYGNDYFKVPSIGANALGGSYMTPQQGDNWPQVVAQAQAMQASRNAFRSTQYANFFASGQDQV